MRNNTVNNSFRSMPDVLDFFCLEKSDKVQRQNIAEFVNKILAPIGACSCCDRVCYEKDMKKANQEQAQFHCIKPGDFLCPACLRTQPKTNEFCKFNPKNGLTQHEPLEPRLNWLESRLIRVLLPIQRVVWLKGHEQQGGLTKKKQ